MSAAGAAGAGAGSGAGSVSAGSAAGGASGSAAAAAAAGRSGRQHDVHRVVAAAAALVQHARALLGGDGRLGGPSESGCILGSALLLLNSSFCGSRHGHGLGRRRVGRRGLGRGGRRLRLYRPHLLVWLHP